MQACSGGGGVTRPGGEEGGVAPPRARARRGCPARPGRRRRRPRPGRPARRSRGGGRSRCTVRPSISAVMAPSRRRPRCRGRGSTWPRRAPAPRGSASAARASDTSCCSPADSREPALPHLGVEPLGQRGEALVARRCSRSAASTSSSVALRPADAHVVEDRAVEQEALLGHDDDALAQRPQAWRRAGRRRRRRPRPRSGRRGGRPAWPASTCRRRSARPAPAARRASTVQADVVEHGRSRPS